MIAKENPALEEATKSLYKFNSEVQIRQRCLAREDYYRMIRTYERDLKQQSATIEEQISTIEELSSTIAQLRAELELLKQQQSE